MKRVYVVVLVLCGLLIHFAYGQKPAIVVGNEAGWQKIGEITAAFETENEHLTIMGADVFKAVKFRVAEAPVKIHDVKIFFENGEMQDVSINSELQPGTESSVFNLEHADVELSKVSFTYKTLASSGEKAQVELYGLKAKDNSSAYRDDKDEVDNEVDESSRKIENEAEEAGREIDAEAEQAANEVNEETAEAKQEVDEEAEEAEAKAKKSAENGANAISEAAGKLGAEIEDKPYADKVGPDGQKIYIDKHSKYYYINEQGNKVYVNKWQMKDKPKDK